MEQNIGGYEIFLPPMALQPLGYEIPMICAISHLKEFNCWIVSATLIMVRDSPPCAIVQRSLFSKS